MERGREGGRQEERESKKRNRERGMRGWHSGGKIERRREDGEKGGTSSSRTGRCCLWVYNDLCVAPSVLNASTHVSVCVPFTFTYVLGGVSACRCASVSCV